MLAAKLLAGGGVETQYIDSLFSAYTYTGNGSTQTITNGIDLAGEGGLVWIKQRNQASSHRLFDTSRGVHNSLASNATAATASFSGYLTAFNSNGFSVGTGNDVNESGYPLVSWTFRNADKFYNHTTVVKSSGSNATVSFANLTTLGMVRVKRTDASGSWYIWHRSLTAGKLLIGETTAAEATLGHITVSGTTVTLVNGVIADGTYLVEGFAHDTGTDGLIQCGSFTANNAVTLGWEPQFLMVKRIDSTQQWITYDGIRGYSVSVAKMLNPNLADAETDGGGNPTATGFVPSVTPGGTYIYLAIRRPNKPPTTGTQVYNAIARTGTGAAATVTGVGFAPDLVIPQNRNTANGTTWFSRLQGATKLLLNYGTNAELTDANSLTSFGMDGFSAGTDATNACINTNTNTYINHFFKRAPGVFDVVCYTGTGSATTVSHGLGAVPELMIVKGRNTAGDNWSVYHGGLTSNGFLAPRNYLFLNSTQAIDKNINFWNDTAPTSLVFSVNAGTSVNASGHTYTAYLLATLPGISKVGSYTGNGSSLTLDMGFTTGARFFMVKRTDSTGDWYVFDVTRGIIAGSDPHLSLNTTAAEVTTDDSVDPTSVGLIVNQLAATNINVNAASYVFLAFS